jgi:hypothetical protein
VPQSPGGLRKDSAGLWLSAAPRSDPVRPAGPSCSDESNLRHG